jgi:UDP-N-acetylmuramate: L-alanyl-gamma-D-glutamyl-meso-diaminopimelate ligase
MLVVHSRAAWVAKDAHCSVVRYGSMDDDAEWQAAPAHIDDLGRQHFDVYAGGSSIGRFQMELVGAHNVMNALAVLCVMGTAFSIPWSTSRAALASFQGVKRRQDLIATKNGVRIYDDFAHHPTAVHETLAALRTKHKSGKLFAVFEPRSATACRNLHQADYAKAFTSADRVIFAPLGRANIPDAERLDLEKLRAEIGESATLAPSVDAIVAQLSSEAKQGDTIAILSNGAFGGIYEKLPRAL